MKENIKIWILSFIGLCVIETVINYIFMVLFSKEDEIRIVAYVTCIIVKLEFQNQMQEIGRRQYDVGSVFENAIKEGSRKFPQHLHTH